MCRQDAAEWGRGFAPCWGITHAQSLRQPQRCSPKRERQGRRHGGRAALIIAAVSKCEGGRGRGGRGLGGAGGKAARKIKDRLGGALVWRIDRGTSRRKKS